MTPSDLIERIEVEGGPDRELDALIFRALVAAALKAHQTKG